MEGHSFLVWKAEVGRCPAAWLAKKRSWVYPYVLFTTPWRDERAQPVQGLVRGWRVGAEHEVKAAPGRARGGRWPMADVVAKGGVGSLRAPCGASGTRYVSIRGLILAPPRPSFVAWAGVLRLGRCGAPRPGGRVSQYLPSFPVLPGKLGHAARGARRFDACTLETRIGSYILGWVPAS